MILEAEGDTGLETSVSFDRHDLWAIARVIIGILFREGDEA